MQLNLQRVHGACKESDAERKQRMSGIGARSRSVKLVALAKQTHTHYTINWTLGPVWNNLVVDAHLFLRLSKI